VRRLAVAVRNRASVCVCACARARVRIKSFPPGNINERLSHCWPLDSCPSTYPRRLVCASIYTDPSRVFKNKTPRSVPRSIYSDAPSSKSPEQRSATTIHTRHVNNRGSRHNRQQRREFLNRGRRPRTKKKIPKSTRDKRARSSPARHELSNSSCA